MGIISIIDRSFFKVSQRGEAAVMELREELERLVQGNIIRFGSVRFSSVYKKNIFSDDATILILSGSHGTKEGVSALTNSSLGRSSMIKLSLFLITILTSIDPLNSNLS